MTDLDHKITDWLLKMQRRHDAKDEGCGFVTCRAVAEFLAMDKKAVRAILEDMAARGLIIKKEFTNALMWRTTNLLDWEKPKPPIVRLPRKFVWQRREPFRGLWFDYKAYEDKETAVQFMTWEREAQRHRCRETPGYSGQEMRVIELTESTHG